MNDEPRRSAVDQVAEALAQRPQDTPGRRPSSAWLFAPLELVLLLLAVFAGLGILALCLAAIDFVNSLWGM